MSNSSSPFVASTIMPISDLPPLPAYTLSPLTPLTRYISDFWLVLILPIVAYWTLSMFFHFIDVHDIWPQYRLHTPEEITKRNHVSRYEVARDVIIQQIIQVGMGAVLGLTEPEEMMGKEAFDIAWWAQRVRVAQRALPQLLALLGLNATAISKNVSASHPVLGAVLAGGKYSSLMEVVGPNGPAVPTFASWELFAGKALYYYLVPAVQFLVAIVILDSWQYFLHRAMHLNKWMYTKFHSRHHRLYVPYAYGALYNHPFEGFLLDTIGASIAYKLSFMTARQGLCFFVGSTFKTVDDHSGYALPWDPLQHITGNNSGYHDIHHQSWGIKNNFSQPFFTFWDRALGTIFTGDTKSRYERDMRAVQRKLALDRVEVKPAPAPKEL